MTVDKPSISQKKGSDT